MICNNCWTNIIEWDPHILYAIHSFEEVVPIVIARSSKHVIRVVESSMRRNQLETCFLRLRAFTACATEGLVPNTESTAGTVKANLDTDFVAGMVLQSEDHA